jgi:hypothetical protein
VKTKGIAPWQPSRVGAANSSWRRLSWRFLPNGQEVRLSQNGENIGTGVVDGSTPDGSIMWVVLDGCGERRMFHKADYVDVEIPR